MCSSHEHPEALVASLRSWSRLDHPNIVRAVDHYKGPKIGQITMLMEAAGGGDFDNIVKSTRTPDYALIGKLMYQSLKAVKYVNDKGIVHSDIKPENIMLSTKCSSGDCHAKLADFGVSCWERKDCRGMCGTPLFMSPEMCTSNNRHKSDDAWALGVTLHRMLYKKFPVKHFLRKIFFR